jgi:ATP-dependent DNA ligase
LFVPKTPDIPYGNRLDLLSKLMPKLTEYSSFIMPVDTIFVENCKMASIKAQEYIKIGYEGGIVRRTDKPYEFSYNGKHSNYLCKIKNRQDGEFEITGYVYGGKGRHQNLIKWEVKNDAGRKFHVSMNISDEENMNLGAKFTKNPEAFTKNFLGKYVTILYAEMSEDGIPLQSKATNYFRHPNHEEAEEYEKLNALYEELKI